MRQLVSKLIIVLGIFISLVKASPVNPQDDGEPGSVSQWCIKYGSREELETYLTLVTPGKELGAIMPCDGVDMNELLRQNPEIFIAIQKKYGCTREFAPHFWDRILSEFPRKTFTFAEVHAKLLDIATEAMVKQIAQEPMTTPASNIFIGTNFKKHQFMMLLCPFEIS